jgi:hypothetical protein
MEQPLSFNSLFAIPKSCVYGDVPNGVGKTFLDFSIVHFKSFAGPMATPAGEFIFMKKPSNLFVDGRTDGRLGRAARGWWTGVLRQAAGLTQT